MGYLDGRQQITKLSHLFHTKYPCKFVLLLHEPPKADIFFSFYFPVPVLG